MSKEKITTDNNIVNALKNTPTSAQSTGASNILNAIAPASTASIPTVSVVKGSVEEQALKAMYGDKINLTYGDNQFVGANRADTANQYQNYLKGLGVKPTGSVDLNSLTGTAVNNGKAVNAEAPLSDLDALMQYLQQTADSQVASQTAILEANKAQSIAELEQAYANAVAEGNISIRDAQAQFDAQKKQIEADAYANADRTALYGVDNGIQNSQQMQGLIRGDQARTATLNNTNASTRDSRINDIKDRLTQVAAQKDFGTATANATYNSGVAQAKANAGQLVAQNMFDVMNQDRQAKQQHAYDLDTIKVQSAETVKQMQLGHTLDMEKIKTQFQNDLQMESIQYGHQSALQSQANKAEMERLTKQAELDIQKEQKAYETSVSRELAKYKKGTPEYNIRVAQLKESRDQKIADIHANTMYEYKMKEITENPALETDNKTKPTSYEELFGKYGFGLATNAGKIIDFFNNYNGQKKEYNAYQEALKRKDDFLKNPEKYLGF